MFTHVLYNLILQRNLSPSKKRLVVFTHFQGIDEVMSMSYIKTASGKQAYYLSYFNIEYIYAP